MFGFKKKKNYLNRKDFINFADSNKIWSKLMTLDEIKELMEYLKIEISKYDFDVDKNFIMNTRRKGLKSMIEARGLENELIQESLFNFWEFVNDEYSGNLNLISNELGISMQELTKMDDEYRKKGIICIQERDEILEIIEIIKCYTKECDV